MRHVSAAQNAAQPYGIVCGLRDEHDRKWRQRGLARPGEIDVANDLPEIGQLQWTGHGGNPEDGRTDYGLQTTDYRPTDPQTYRPTDLLRLRGGQLLVDDL